MKIRSYLAILIAACLLGGYLIEYVLSAQYNQVNRLSEAHSEARIWIKDLERVNLDTAQYLISVDLVLGSDHTYLVSGTLAKGKLIIDNLELLAKENALLPNEYQLGSLFKSVKKINGYLERSQLIGSTDREVELLRLLTLYDRMAISLDNKLAEVKSIAHQQMADNTAALETLRKYSKRLERVTQIAFSLLLLFLWVWADRKMSTPLRQLKNMASRAGQGQPFESIQHGPAEIKQLSSHFAELTNSLSYQASHDPLTQLFNRRAFQRVMLEALNDANDKQLTHVLCFIDLDRFKAINDTCGHAAGDELLNYVASLLTSSVRTSDVVARLGGDEFAILLVDCGIDKGVSICNHIRNAIRDYRYQWGDSTFSVSASIGVTLIDDKGETIAEILNAADNACKFAKESGRDKVNVLAVGDKDLLRHQQEAERVNQLIVAIDENRFALFKQDIISLADSEQGKYFEILIRLKAEDGKLISAGEFLPLAERYFLSKRLDKWVVNTVIDWLLDNPQELELMSLCSINLSGQSIACDELRQFIVDKLQQTHFPAEKLCFEITETAAVTDLDSATAFIEELKMYGCQFALDDFGSGLSSFAYLKQLPVDIIKIDGFFVKDMLGNSIDLATVKAIHEVAKAVGKKTVAEFVETVEIADMLRSIGIDYAQGYYFDKPKTYIDAKEIVQVCDNKKPSFTQTKRIA